MLMIRYIPIISYGSTIKLFMVMEGPIQIQSMLILGI